MLRVENISKIIRKSHKIISRYQNISFKIVRGEYVAIFAPKNSGKSLILSSIATLTPPDKGKIFLHSRDIYALKKEELLIFRQKTIGAAFKEMKLLPYLTVEENILIPSLQLPDYNNKENLNYLLSLLELKNVTKKYPNELTCSEYTMTILARAMCNRPSLLILDELSDNLRPSELKIFNNGIKKFIKENQSAVLTSVNAMNKTVAATRIIDIS